MMRTEVAYFWNITKNNKQKGWCEAPEPKKTEWKFEQLH